MVGLDTDGEGAGKLRRAARHMADVVMSPDSLPVERLTDSLNKLSRAMRPERAEA